MLFVALLIVASLIVVFRLGNQASAGVALSDPVVWVEDGARGRLLQINGSTQEITAAIDIGEAGDSLVAIPRGRDAVYRTMDMSMGDSLDHLRSQLTLNTMLEDAAEGITAFMMKRPPQWKNR